MTVEWWGIVMLGALVVAFCAFPTGETPPWEPFWRNVLGLGALAFFVAVVLLVAVEGALS